MKDVVKELEVCKRKKRRQTLFEFNFDLFKNFKPKKRKVPRRFEFNFDIFKGENPKRKKRDSL